MAVRERVDVHRTYTRVETISGSNPQPGAAFTLRVPGTAIMRPLSVMATLTAGAGGSDRGVWLEYRGPTNTRFLVAGAEVKVAPGTTQSFCWHPNVGNPAWPVDDVALAPLPVQPLDSRNSLAVVIGDAEADDQLSAIIVRAEFEWSDAEPDEIMARQS